MAKFTIYAGKSFEADFTVVSSDGITGEPLDPSDTGTFSLVLNGEAPTCILAPVDLTITDADNGQFTLNLTEAQTSELKQYIGFREDNFSPISNYDGFLEFTLASGNRQATVPVSVKEVPSCPVTP